MLRFCRFALLALILLACVGPVTVRADGTRTIILVRHGQYEQDDPRGPENGQGLTATGRDEARHTAARIAHLGQKVDALYASPMTRARQTAAILGDSLGMRPELLDDLRECTPPTVRADVMASSTPGSIDSCQKQLDRDYDRFFHPTSGPDSTVVLVCHGNVTRYLAGRALGLDSKLWLNMQISHCSVSTVRVRPGNKIQIISIGDSGHLPPELTTFTNPTGWDSTKTQGMK